MCLRVQWSHAGDAGRTQARERDNHLDVGSLPLPASPADLPFFPSTRAYVPSPPQACDTTLQPSTPSSTSTLDEKSPSSLAASLPVPPTLPTRVARRTVLQLTLDVERRGCAGEQELAAAFVLWISTCYFQKVALRL